MDEEVVARGMSADFDLTQPHAIHVVGVGGAGMSAIATVLARMGHTVSGSDLREFGPRPRTSRMSDLYGCAGLLLSLVVSFLSFLR